VLMDLGAGSDTVVDAIETIRARLASPRLVISPTPMNSISLPRSSPRPAKW
jgi:hypothetical protein